MQKVTIGELAEITGYSKSTVSCAINGKPGVGEKAKEEILKKAKEIGFVPNFFAQNVSNSSFKSIGVMLRDIRNPFYANVFSAIEEDAEKAGYEVLFYDLAGKKERVTKGLEFLRSRMVDGIIVDVFGAIDDIRESLVNSNIPFVVFGLNVAGDVSCVQTDDENGSRNAVDYGVETGHTNIFYISRGLNDVYDVRRSKTICERVAFHGLECQDIVLRFEETTIGKTILAKCPKDSLLICYNDQIACKVISSLMSEGYYVPKDYSVIGFDNMPLLPYPLTTVDIPESEMAHRAIGQLIKEINGGKKEKITLSAKLIKRGSVSGNQE